MAKTNSVKLRESILAEKSLEVLVDTKLNRSQQGDFATKAAYDTLGCTRQNIASSWREVTLLLCSALCWGLGYLIKKLSWTYWIEPLSASPSPSHLCLQHSHWGQNGMLCQPNADLATAPRACRDGAVPALLPGGVRLLLSSTAQHFVPPLQPCSCQLTVSCVPPACLA